MRTSAVAASLVGIVLAVLLLRLAIVRADPESHWARQVSPEHPSVLAATAMREVGVAAAQRAIPSNLTLKRIRELAHNEPLSVYPFLVEGAIAEKEGALNRAEQLYGAALRLQPRSAAAHYLLTDLYLRTGDTANGMREIAELSRLVPGGSVQLVPALAQFARSPGAADQLRRIFASDPQLEQPVLSSLAADPANAELILSVANRTGSGPGEAAPEWEEKLLDAMIAQGSYEKAYAIWTKITGNRNGAGLFNPAFRQTNAPPPFNWSFVSAQAGVAEPENGSLRILFYGRNNATLARQILLLPPGHYRLTVSVAAASGNAGTLAWAIICLPDRKQIFNLPLSGNGETQTLAGEFEIPTAGCGAQQIELDGTMEDSPETADLRIGALSLQRTGA